MIGYYEGDRLLYVSKVRAGFVPRVRREVAKRFIALQPDACPFANLPETKRTQWALMRDQMKGCVWLLSELVHRLSTWNLPLTAM